MAKAKSPEIPLPDPLPKIGDTVNYVWPDGTDKPQLAGKVLTAKVTSVYTDLESRVVDLDVESGKGPLAVKGAPWRDDAAGNTWHWPE
jgi:hypothetical protein